MPRKTQEQPDVPPFEFRPGVGLPPFGGMYRRGDPAQIPSHRLHLGVNIRLANGEVGNRPGLTPVEGQSQQACITGIFEIDDFAVAIYINMLGDAGVDPPGASPWRIIGFNEEKTPPVQNYWDEVATGYTKVEPRVWRRNGVDAFNAFQRFNDSLLIANGKAVHEVGFSEDDGVPRMDLTLLCELPASAAGDIYSTCVRSERLDNLQTGEAAERDVLYLGCAGGEVWRYDGTTLELVHTLTSGGPMQILTWKGMGLVAAGDNAGGFCYQAQPGYSWTDQSWGRSFWCNGLCEFLGEVVFVGDWDDEGGWGKWGAYALRWAGSGSPTVFESKVPLSSGDSEYRFRTPVVAAGALHWLYYQDDSNEPEKQSPHIARYTGWATGDLEWGAPGYLRFFIPYRGALLAYKHHQPGNGLADLDHKILLIHSGSSFSCTTLYTWPTDTQLDGTGYEAIPS